MLVPRFTPLTVDLNSEESRTNRSKSPTSTTRPSAPGALSPHLTFNNETSVAVAAAKVPHKSSTNTQSTRNPVTTTQDENMPSNNDTGPSLSTANALLTSMPKAVPVKKRSSNLVRSSVGRRAHSLHLSSILRHRWYSTNTSWARRWAMAISLLFIDRSYAAAIVNLPSKSSTNPRCG